MATASSESCPSCGGARAPDAPLGLCPACQLRGGLESEVTTLDRASVMETLADCLGGTVPRVLLSDTNPGLVSPVTRPGSPEVPAVGVRQGHLRVQGEIARGGMGAVLRGRDEDLGRDLAVKVLLERHGNNPDLVRRFVEEAQICGQLQHPGVVPIYELGIFSDRRPYFAMKLVKGQTLAALLAGRSGPEDGLPRFLGIFEQVCQTMAYAHARGVIHRDLKPSNVMVGAFGEVQVMDRGLAKVLARGGVLDDAEAGKEALAETVIAPVRSGEGESDLSRAGSVLGTPSYMAPEQARGEVERVNERADVFALGSILCEILTGKPAFSGRSVAEIQGKAARGDLGEALERLGASGADGELVSLVRVCLAEEPQDRPCDAGVVAEGIAAYLAGVQERLRASEVARAAESARAEEARRTAEAERRSRRLTAALAASVLGLIAVGVGSYGWSQYQRAERRAKTASAVSRALAEAAHLRGEAQAENAEPGKWAEALAAAKRAESLVQQGEADPALRLQVSREVARLRREREEIEADRRLLSELETARGAQYEYRNAKQVDAVYASAFRKGGLDLDSTDPRWAGAWIAGRSEPVELASYLDDWALVRLKAGWPEAKWRRLVAVARVADPDPWRDALRAKLEARDESAASAFRTLADDAEALDEQPAASLVLLAAQLRDGIGDHARAEAVLQRAWRRFPGDFWVNFELARAPGRDRGGRRAIYPRPAESARYLTAAVAIRPGSAMAHQHLAWVLIVESRLPEAIAECREAIRLDPRDAGGYLWLGTALWHVGDLDSAAAVLRKAVELQFSLTTAHNNLGSVLREQGDLDGAAAEHVEALRLAPRSPVFHCNYAITLEKKGDLNAALGEYRRALRLRPKYSEASVHLASLLLKSGDARGAVEVLRKALRSEPEWVPAHYCLGRALRESGDLAGAIGEFREVVRLESGNAHAHHQLGLCLRQAGDLSGAIWEFREAVRLKPENASFHGSLAAALREAGTRPVPRPRTERQDG